MTAPLWLLILLQAAISAASLIVEIVAGRMIAPYVGMSLYTWTSIIAVVLAGFSVGHWWGGRLAAGPSERAMRRAGWTMLAAALVTAGASMVLRLSAGPVLSSVEEPLTAILVLTTLAFFLPSLFAGVPAPILAVVAMRAGEGQERALGAMFAAGAVGAIAGTLLAGFVFVSWLGSIATLAVIAAAYALAGVLCLWLGRARAAGLGTAAGVAALTLGLCLRSLALPAVCDVESSHYCIRTAALAGPGEPAVNLMVIDHLAHGISGADAPRVMFTEHAAMLDALPRMRMGTAEFSSFHIGGGSYSVPRAWADRGIGGITVAEVDPAVTRQAVRDFWFDPGSATVLHADARVALARSPARYDVIVGDAFTDIAVPAHLVTAEFFTLVAERLTPDGIFAMNLIDRADRLAALAALVATLRTVFPSVEVWTEARPPDPGERRVFVLLAGAADSPVSAITAPAPDPRRFAALGPAFVDDVVARAGGLILTDDFVPIDRLMGLDRTID